MSENINLENQNRKTKRSDRLKRRRKILFALFGGIFFITVLYVLLLQASFTSFTSVSVDHTELSPAVQKSAEESLAKTSYIVGRRASLLSPTKNLVAIDIRRDIEEIESLHLKTSFVSRTLSVLYTLRTPVLRADDGTYIDTHNESYHDRRENRTPLLTTTKKVTDDELVKIIFLKDTIETALFPIVEVQINDDRDVTFVLDTVSHTKVMFSLLQDEKDVWSKIVSALDTAPLVENKDTFAKVDVLDVRFGNKVYYKMVVQDGMVIPESTATTTYERKHE